MSNLSKAKKIRGIFDNKLDIDRLTESAEGVDQGSIKIFQKLFVEILNFEPVTGGVGGIAEEVSTDDWSKSSNSKKAYFFAESMDFRIFYVNLEKLTRTSERHAVKSMRGKGWIRKKEFIAIFHSDDSDVWHLVSPYVEEGEGRTILRRYVVGKGETHRTVSQNLAEMDASKPETLYERVQDAFKLQPVTKEFYEDYKSNYSDLYTHFTNNEMDLREAKRYAHLILNRFMFLYFLQKKRWLNGDKNFINWFYSQYEKSDDENCFHEKWLNELFFKAINDREIDEGLPDDIREILKDFPFLNGGLFAEKEFEEEGIPEDAYLTDDMAGQVIKRFLDEYNFTVTEESPVDRDVAVDPAMLGKIYESLIAEEERGKSGIFYTPRVEVDLMCKLALYEYLVTKADDPGEEGKKNIIEFIFKPLEKWENDEEEDVSKLMDILHDAKVVDPACGSGAFLVGMMQVFSELYRKLGEEPDYKFRERIVNENLHGVDIKDWAVRMAEFRLWLALVESEEELPDVEPILPNFSFKLKVGDSIVQKVGDEHLSLDKMMDKAGKSTVNKIEELKNLKKDYFEGNSDLEGEIKEKQRELIKGHLQKSIENLEDKKNQSQMSLTGEVTEGSKDKKEEIEKEIESIEETIEKVEEAEDKGLFVWNIDFPEVMIDGGFDLVIANPPYVRQEKIISQDIDPEELEEKSKSEKKKLKKKYKNDLVSYVKDAHDIKVGKRSDLYIYFFFKGLELLNDEGNLVFISSNSWLDVKYGKYLQEYLCKYVPIKGIFNNKAKRSFEEADVNTVISVFGAPDVGEEDFGKKYTLENVWPAISHDARFINFNRPFGEVNKPDYIIALEKSDNYNENIKSDILDFNMNKTDGFRTVKIKQRNLLEDGWGYPKNYDGKPFEKGKYKGNKWGGKFLRAPDIFFNIIDKGEGKLTSMKELTDDIRFGIKTGANKFFFVNDITKEISSDTFDEVVGSDQITWFEFNKNNKLRVIHSLGKKFIIESKFLVPVIKSPRETKSPILTEKKVSKRLIRCNEKDVSDKFILNYIEAGEEEDYHLRSTCSSRNPWYSLGDRKPANYLWMEFINDINRVYVNKAKFLESDKFYGILTENNLPLNCTLISMFRELSGFSSLGQGALKLAVYEVESLLVPDIEVDENLDDRKMESIFEEVGLIRNKPIREQEPNPLPDRKKLDDIIFDALNLTEDERKEVYWAVAELVKARLDKAKSV